MGQRHREPEPRPDPRPEPPQRATDLAKLDIIMIL